MWKYEKRLQYRMGRSREALPAVMGSGSVYGSYIHGLFDAPHVADTILKALCIRKGIGFDTLGTFDAAAYRERQYDILADTVRQGLDMALVYRILNREV